MSDARKSAENAIAMIQSALCEWEEKLATARSALEDKKPMTSALLGEKADLAGCGIGQFQAVFEIIDLDLFVLEQ